MLANYHTHTKRCNHADGEDKQYVEAAIKGGMKVLGFSDHCPWIYKDESRNGVRMLSTELEDYCTSLLNLRKEYEKDITIYIGLESEYMEELIEKQNQLFAEYPIDYMILGQHFNYLRSNYAGQATSDDEVLKTYVDLIIKGIKTNKYSYVAHPDLINYTGNVKTYELHMRRLSTFLKEVNVPIEFNILGYKTKRNYPNKMFWEIAKEVGNRAIVGVDAHTPSFLTEYKDQNACREMIISYGLEVVDYLEGLGPKGIVR